jgi:hypothetical protein
MKMAKKLNSLVLIEQANLYMKWEKQYTHKMMTATLHLMKTGGMNALLEFTFLCQNKKPLITIRNKSNQKKSRFSKILAIVDYHI